MNMLGMAKRCKVSAPSRLAPLMPARRFRTATCVPRAHATSPNAPHGTGLKPPHLLPSLSPSSPSPPTTPPPQARFLISSTSEVYGDPLEHPQRETYWGNVNCIGERSCYDEGKRIAETLTMDYWREHRLEVRIIRIFNTYGPRMALDDGRVVSNFVSQALTGKPLTVYGDGSQTRSFQYISDLIAGMVAVMEGNEIGGWEGGGVV